MFVAFRVTVLEIQKHMWKQILVNIDRAIIYLVHQVCYICLIYFWLLFCFDSVCYIVFGPPFVKRFALCYRTVVLSCLSVLSVTLVNCGQTVGWIKMQLGKQVGLGPGHIVLDGNAAPPPPSFRPISVVAKRLDGSRWHLA